MPHVLTDQLVREAITRRCVTARTPVEIAHAWAAEARAFAAQGGHPDGAEKCLRYAAGKEAEAAALASSGKDADIKAFWRGYHS